MTPVLSSPAGRDAHAAFLIVWLILGAVAFTAVLAPLVLSEDSVARLTPVCVWKAKLNRECPGCGLTRSFLLIARGRFEDASAMNRAGPPLYAAFTANGVVLMAWLARRIVMTRKPKGGVACRY